MPAEGFALDFYGVTAALRGPRQAALACLERDFGYFRAAVPGKVNVELTLLPCAPPPEAARRRAFWRWRSARIWQRGAVRTVDYEGRALLEHDFSADRGVLRSAEPELLRELAYLALLSRVGARLDRARLHRVHALGFAFRGKGGLLLLPSGGGKSWLALELLRRDGFELLSDDAPLVHGADLAAFPLGIGLRGDDRRGVPAVQLRPFARRRFGLKHVVDLEYFRGRVRPRAPLTWLLVGERRGASAPRVERCSKTRAAAALAANLVLGLGTPQILELTAPFSLPGVALRRARCAAAAVAVARCGRFALGPDPAENARALEEFLSA